MVDIDNTHVSPSPDKGQKRRRSFAVVVAAVAAVLPAGTAVTAHADTPLVLNGGFEAPAVDAGTILNSTTGLPGWSVDRGNVDVIHGVYGSSAAEGTQYIDLDGNTPATIDQQVPTSAGSAYTLSYVFTPNPDASYCMGGNNVGFTVSWGGHVVDTESLPPTNQWVALGWQSKAIDLTASSASTALSFASTDPAGACGMLLDAVTLTPLPDVFVETTDAGALPTTATDITTGQHGSIVGSGDCNDIDVYRIYVADPAAFSATTVDPGTPPAVNTMLALFDANGVPVERNDDTTATDVRATLPAGNAHAPSAPGFYYLAVSGSFDLALDANGTVSFLGTGTAVVGPYLGAAAPPVDHWDTSYCQSFGTYEVDLTGTAPAPTGPTPPSDTAPSAPGAPSGPASSGTGAFTLTWTGSSDPDGDPVDHYVLEHAPATDPTTWSTVGTPASTSYSFTSSAPESDGRWVYRVAGVDSNGTQGDFSAPSATSLVDTLPPSIAFTGCPTAPVGVGTSYGASWTASDSGSGLQTPSSGTAPLDTSSIGAKSVTVAARDQMWSTTADDAAHSASATCHYTVGYRFDGVYKGLSNGAWNKVNAGQAVPVKFSLDGPPVANQSDGFGTGVFVAGTPSVQPVACPSHVTTYAATTTSASTSQLQYDPVADQYIYVWKTPSSLSGTCATLTLTFGDGVSEAGWPASPATSVTLRFMFK